MTTAQAKRSARASETSRKVVAVRSKAGSRMDAAEAKESTRARRTLSKVVDATRTLGEQTAFYGNALGATGDAIRRYPGEVLRLVAVMGMGTGALAVIGGTVVIVGFLTLTT